MNILVVDDDRITAKLIVHVLEQQGHQCQSAFDGENAYKLLQSATFDLLISDWMMPKMNGIDLCREVRKLTEKSYVYVILLTSLDEDDSKQEAIEAGVDDYLTKPLNRDELVARLAVAQRIIKMERGLMAKNRQIETHLKRLTLLDILDVEISARRDLHEILQLALKLAHEQLYIDAASIYLIKSDHPDHLTCSANFGFADDVAIRLTIPLGDGVCGRAVTVGYPQFITVDQFAEEGLVEDLTREFLCCIVFPLVNKGVVRGVMETYFRSGFDPGIEWRETVDAMGNRIAIAVDGVAMMDEITRSHRELSLAYDTTLEALCKALDLRDGETHGHSLRVTEMTVELAELMDLPKSEMARIRRGALLHDIGKLGVPDNILLKPGPLTPEEREVMSRHPDFAREMLQNIPVLNQSLSIPYGHHEKWDGTGYPRGLKGEEIPVEARIFAVADVCDALTSNRPYRQAWPLERVVDYMKENSGSHFDPSVIDAFLRLVSPRLATIEQSADKAA